MADGLRRHQRAAPRSAPIARIAALRMAAVSRIASGLGSRGVKQITDELYLLRGFPPNAINVYLMGNVVVDAATRHAGRRILRQVRGHPVTAHALTHAHSDHQGASAEICKTLDIPYWCGRDDVAAAETGDIAR